MEKAHSAMQRYVDEGKVAGISTLVIQKGETIHSACYGMLDIAAGKPLQSDSLFRIYSLTKPITAAAILMLLEEGLLNLDDPIARYIPELGKMKVYSTSANGDATLEPLERDVTIWHLLTHTSGMAEGSMDDGHPVEQMYQQAGYFGIAETLQVPLDETVSRIAQLPLAFQPGASWRYSIAYDILGYLLQIIAGMPFDEFLQQRIFAPLQMIDTGFFVPPEKGERLGPMYTAPEDGKIAVWDGSEDSPFLKPDIPPSGSAGLVSTINDYAHFLELLANSGQRDGIRLLSPDIVKQMTSNHLAGDQFPVRFSNPWEGLGYGLGVGVQRDHTPEEGWPAGCFGWLGSSGTCAWVFPEESVSIISMPQAYHYFEPAFEFQSLVYGTVSS